jgi:hypothetical protein
MTDVTADWRAVLATMSDAFLAGDNARGEELLACALDAGVPWDVATSTVAQALGTRATALKTANVPVAAPA